ncbi:lysophospholipid acyltransferase family protein [Robertkochia aurantiaca]|uniref:lysophospholipid acyltransferase family protein n=1 Tax=Robertkochia aurantiaca TaxID=2873700 RepID=UPI001CCFDA8B|nr:lysophospholipid acyltransferase family protein [Robertkochia sp. 3YJGBD-33]
MAKLFAYPLTIIYYLVFGLTLLIFHPIQWICYNLFGYQAHKKSVDYLNFCLTACLYILGHRVRFDYKAKPARNIPSIIVANHQSMNDIPPIIWHMRKLHPKFISKKELGKGIPSVSYNLRHGGSVLIDRKDPDQAIAEIRNIAAYAEKNKRGVVIFPEGTRSRTGAMKKFRRTGIKTLIRNMPTAQIVPVTVNNSWKTLKYGKFPMGLGAKITFTVHEPLLVSSATPNELIDLTEEKIVSAIDPNIKRS